MNHDDTPYERGRLNCILDDTENAPFSSTGGLKHRDTPTLPKWLYKDEYTGEYRAEFMRGYVARATEMYGDDWKTCTFSWSCVMEINPKED